MYSYVAVDGYTFRSTEPTLAYYLVVPGGTRYFYSSQEQLEEAKQQHQRYSAGKVSLM